MSTLNTLRQSRQNIDLQLEQVKNFMHFLGNPQERYKSIIIGGTNGKGSVCNFLSKLTHKYSSKKVGRYISPHLIERRERIIINEKALSKKEFNRYHKYTIKKAKEFELLTKARRKLTEFEIYTAMAFYVFSKKKVDIAYLEVGMGGRLDATNIVSSTNTICSVITNVSYDHMDFLGKTIEKISYEKAGIIKEKNILFTQCTGKALAVIKKQCEKQNSKLCIVKTNNKKSYYHNNRRLALAVWKDIKRIYNFSAKKEEEYLNTITIPARFHLVKNKFIIDGAHNEAGAVELKKLITEKLRKKNLTYIIGMLNKDYKKFLRNLSPKGIIIFTEPKSDRATKKEILKIHCKSKKSLLVKDISSAIKIAQKQNSDYIIITGSLYLAGEAYKSLKQLVQ